jgi:hypothetical protein
MTNRSGVRVLSLIASACLLVAACDDDDAPPKAKATRLSTDVHVAIAEHPLVLPFVALEDYAYRHQSFTLDPEGDRERAIDAVDALLRDSADPLHPLTLDQLSILVRTYGWNDFEEGARAICPLLKREWARSVCDDPWAAVQQALPSDSFRLIDLGRLNIADPHSPANCVHREGQRQHLPQAIGEAAILCEAMVFGGSDHYRAVVRIDGDLGALWYMSGKIQNGESMDARLEREGQAILAFVQNALGPVENFSTLHAVLCRLRRPNSSDHPNRPPDCAA